MKSFFLYRFLHKKANSRSDVLLAFLSAQIFDPEEFDKTIQDEIERDLKPDQILIVLRNTAFDHAVQSFREPKMSSLITRFPGDLSIVVVGFDEFGNEVRRESINGNSSHRVHFDDFKNRAMTSIFRQRGGFVNASEACHFENPSGRHTRRFMRLSNMLVDGAEISFCAFCILSSIPTETSAVYIDTPALFGLIGSINSHFRGLGCQRNLLADNFHSYEGLKDYEFTKAENALVLISASSSGSLADRVTIAEPLFDEKNILHIVFLGKKASEYRTVCDLAKSKQNPEGFDLIDEDYKAGNCRLCEAGSIAIPLEGDQFDIAGPRPASLLVNIDDAPRGLQDVMLRIVGQTIFGTGLGKPRGIQPRQFDINAKSLLASSKFKERLNYVLARSIPSKIGAIVVLDDASRPLAQKVIRTWGYKPKPPILSLEDLRQRDRNEGLSPILIVAIVIESGRSLLDISRYLRSTFPKAPQIYIVGFAKILSREKLNELERNLVQTASPQKHELAITEQMVLPPSARIHTWTKELALLQKYLNGVNQIVLANKDGTAVLRARKELLMRSSHPLVDNLFLSNEINKPLKLQHGFVFWPESLTRRPHSQADVYFTISSVLQSLRANATKPGGRALRSERLQHTLLSPSNFGRFNDGIIQSSFLRAAMPSELNYAANPDESYEMFRIVRRILEDVSRPRGEAAAEFLMAIAIGHLNFWKEHYKELLKPIKSAPPLISILLSICKEELKERVQIST